jgi:hypothetical protein
MTGTITVSAENSQGADVQEYTIDVTAADAGGEAGAAGNSSVSCGFSGEGSAGGMMVAMTLGVAALCLSRRRARHGDIPLWSRNR